MNKILATFTILSVLAGSSAYAAAPPAIRESVAICDPNSPTHCAAPSSSGTFPVSLSGTGSTTGVLGVNGTSIATGVNTFPVGLYSGNGTLIMATSTGVDAIAASVNANSNTAAGTNIGSYGRLFNGTTYDRTRSIQGIDGTGLGVQAVEQNGNSTTNITAAVTTTIKSGAGVLHKVCVNTPVASATVTIYNSVTATGTKIATLTLPSVITGENPFCLVYDAYFSTGLTVVASGATDLTITSR